MIVLTSINEEYNLEGTCSDFQKLYNLMSFKTDFVLELDSSIDPSYYDNTCLYLSIKYTKGKIRFESVDKEFIISGSADNLDIFRRNIKYEENYQGHIHFDYISYPMYIEDGHELIIGTIT